MVIPRLENSTVVALASAPGEGGVAVVRISGPKTFEVARRVFLREKYWDNPEPWRAVYGILSWPHEALSDSRAGGSPVDEVMVLPYRAPQSYTGEDTVEIFCHGGRIVSQSVVAACRAAGAEPATAGEFTRRAFLNGKLSLDQAEAVAELIHAQSEQAARAAMKQLLGGLDQQLRDIENPLLDLLSRVEGSLEFVAEEEISVPQSEVLQVLNRAVSELVRLIKMAPAGRLLREGIHLVLAGPPNAGKSSLFNALLEDDRAIVDAEAGTTRDVISGQTHRAGSVFVLHDTAGLRTTPGRIEGKGIERTWRQVAEADIVLHLNPAGSESHELGECGEAVVLSVVTKRDLSPDTTAPSDAIFVSSTTGEGLSELWAAVDDIVARFRLAEAVSLGVILNERHVHKLTACRSDLERLHQEVELNNPGDEIVGSLLSSILSDLGEVSGRVFAEHLLESVFQRFCVGK